MVFCEAKWRKVHNTANILLNTARLGGAFFHHAHAYAILIVNSCPAKNVTDKMETQQHPTNTAMAENQSLPTSAYLDAQSTSNVMNRLSATS
jgi:hypothetical protein